MWQISEATGEKPWQVLDASGAVVGEHVTREDALAQLADLFAAQTDPETETGLLPERWTSGEGIAFTEVLPDGRDFATVTWTWRDPEVSLLPLMLQTVNEPGHDGAVLAGFIETIREDGGTVSASGRFLDTDEGKTARDILRGSSRFGVSVDPGPGTQATFTCTEEEDGWCIDGYWSFQQYEIVGLTMTPFPGFPRATITIDDPEPVVATAAMDDRYMATIRAWEPYIHQAPGSAYQAVTAAGAVEAPQRVLLAPREWFENPGFERPSPLAVTEDGRISGHLALWGECHIGLGPGCVTPPFEDDHQFFHLGTVDTTDGPLPCGVVTLGCGHADTNRPLTIAEVLSHYDNAGTVAAYVRAGADEHGPWVSGWVDPDLSPRELRQLKACKLSGDWREVRGQLRLVAALSVPVPGFGVPHLTAAVHGGRVTALVAGMADQPCGCGGADEPEDAWRARVERALARHDLIVSELRLDEQTAERIAASI